MEGAMQVGHAFRSPPSPHVTALRLAVAPSGRCRLCGATATGAASLALVGVGACAARRASRLPRSAIQAQETKHARAVRKWLEDVVIGFGFCPWAAPADIRARPAMVKGKEGKRVRTAADILYHDCTLEYTWWH